MEELKTWSKLDNWGEHGFYTFYTIVCKNSLFYIDLFLYDFNLLFFFQIAAMHVL